VDVDRFIARNERDWYRLEQLSATARRSPKRLAPDELDELVALYQRASGHLAHARAAFDDPGLLARLNRVVGDANATLYGRGGRSRSSLRRFLTRSFPAAVWVSRRFALAAAACLFVPAIAMGAWLANSDEALDVAIPRDQQENLVASEFEDYYSSAPASQFSTAVLVNNIQVSIMAFALGVLGCLPTAALLVYNGLHVGILGGLFVAEGRAGTFFGLILPHGLLELSAVVLTAAAGLRIGWALLVPGDRRRGDALAEEGRRSVVVVLGCTIAFVCAGIIEGFVTPSSLPIIARDAIGVVVEVAFLAWVLGLGRLAAAEGFTGVPADDAAVWEARSLVAGTS
jgi:uncharacterized membrane protein SpoIIM required for sporulation